MIQNSKVKDFLIEINDARKEKFFDKVDKGICVQKSFLWVSNSGQVEEAENCPFKWDRHISTKSGEILIRSIWPFHSLFHFQII